MHRYSILLFFVLLFCFTQGAYSNDLRINAPEVNESTLSFSISWENSWNLINTSVGPENKDAVWVFAKARTSADGEWFHLPLLPQTYNFTCTPKLEAKVPQDGRGAFISLAAVGASSVSSCRIELEVDSTLQLEKLDIRIYGIEMVYIPQAAYWLGDATSKYSFINAETQAPYFLNSEDQLETGSEDQLETGLTAGLTSLGENRPATDIPAAYPKGFAAFYCMKYEISQEQFVDFLNSLPKNQQQNHIAVPLTSPAGTFALAPYEQNRNGIAIKYPAIQDMAAVFSLNGNKNEIFGEADDAATRACNFLNWENVTAYLDWAALRPMTELEFEKISRGPAEPVAKEFAWGTPFAENGNTVLQDGTAFETVAENGQDTVGLANYGAGLQEGYLQGPLRTGFAATAETNRITAGSSWYGVMEMSGNVWEACVSTNSEGLQYKGLQGDGQLNEQGFANTNSWPAKAGSGHRGGAWNSLIKNKLEYEFRDLAVSDRYYAFLAVSRRNTTGGRGVRTED